MALRTEMRLQGDFLFKYRSYLPVVIIVIGLYVYIQNKTSQTPNTLFNDYVWYIISFTGLAIRMYAVGYSSDNTSGRNTSEGQIADSINSTGLYSTCRHPLYVGNFFMWLGIAGLTNNLWFIIAFVFMYWVYYERIMYAEEEYLISKYGARYTNWSNTVPAFIPSFKNWTSPKNAFSFKKIIRQEKAGILNLFLVICSFEMIANYVINNEIVFLKSFASIGLLASIAWYIIIKTIQKTSTVLVEDR